jgi:hypothetical protein
MDPSTPPPVPCQLDIFADSHEVMLRNDLLQALQRRDASAARQAASELARESPADALLAPAQLMQQALLDADAPPSGPDDAQRLADARHHLRAVLVPAARAALGDADGRAWLVPLWCDLARRHAQRPWNPALPDDHAAPLWLAAGAWAQAEQAVARIASWRRIPLPLAWMTEARYRLADVDAVWPLLAELAWLAPRRLRTLLDTLADPLLQRLCRRFELDFEPGAQMTDGNETLAWWPAWVLTQTPALAPQLAQAEPGQAGAAERGLRLMVELLGLERQGRHHDVVARRKALRDLCAPLYAACMATR